MKKILLSCLTLVLALTFANAQLPTVAPPAGLVGTPVIIKHLYICDDQLRPVDLSYDVLGVYADDTKGRWIGSYPGSPIPAGFYDGRNVFKVEGVTPGTYVFDFATNPGIGLYCGVLEKQYLRAFVHIVPSLAASKNPSLAVCKDESLVNYINPLSHLNAAEKLAVENAGGTFTSTPFTPVLSSAVLGTTHHTSTITISGLPGSHVYPCGASFTMSLALTVDTLKITGINTHADYCWDLVKTTIKDPWAEFGRTPMSGAKYQVVGLYNGGVDDHLIDFSRIIPPLAEPTVGSHREVIFKLTFNDCKNNQERYDTIKIYHTDDMDYPKAINEYCKLGDNLDSADLRYLYKHATTGGGKDLPIGSTTGWSYIGIDNSGTNHGGLDNPLLINGYVDKSKLYSGYEYHFIFKLAPTLAFCGANASDTLIVKPQDGLASADGRFQVCRPTTLGGTIVVDLNSIMGFTGATWLPQSSVNPPIAGSEVTVSDTHNPHNFRYNYTTTGNACNSSTGIFNLKVTEKIVVPSEIVEKFCYMALPSSRKVNLNYIAGTNSGTWTAVSAIPAGVSVNLATGELDIVGLAGATPVRPTTYEFKLTKTPGSCLGHDVTVKIVITADITL